MPESRRIIKNVGSQTQGRQIITSQHGGRPQSIVMIGKKWGSRQSSQESLRHSTSNGRRSTGNGSKKTFETDDQNITKKLVLNLWHSLWFRWWVPKQTSHPLSKGRKRSLSAEGVLRPRKCFSGTPNTKNEKKGYDLNKSKLIIFEANISHHKDTSFFLVVKIACITVVTVVVWVSRMSISVSGAHCLTCRKSIWLGFLEMVSFSQIWRFPKIMGPRKVIHFILGFSMKPIHKLWYQGNPCSLWRVETGTGAWWKVRKEK